MTVGFEEHLRGELRETLGTGPTPRGRWEDIEVDGRRAQRRVRRRRLAVASGVAVAAMLAVIVVAARPSNDPVRVDSGPASSEAPETTLPVARLGVVSTTDLGTDRVSDVAATADGAWVALWGTGEVVRVAAGGGVTARVPIGKAQSGPLAVAAGEGAIWVLDFDTSDLVRIDPATAQVTGRLHLPDEPERVAVGNGKVWVTGCCDQNLPNQRLFRIDPSALRIEHQLQLPGQGETEQVAVNANGVYVSGERFTTVLHIDLAGTRILAQAEVGDTSGTQRNPCVLAAGTGTEVWCSVGSTGKVAIIDAADHVTLVPAPATVVAVGASGDHLVVSTTEGLFLLQDGWVPWGEPAGVGPMAFSPSNDLHSLWAAQGNQLLQLRSP